MKSQNQVVAESSKCCQLFGSSSSRILLSSDSVRIESGDGKPIDEIPIDSVANISVDQSWFWYRLKIESTDGRRHSVGGLDDGGAASIRDAALEIAEQLARAEFANLLRLDEQRLELFGGSRYVRHREAMEFHEAIVSTLARSKGMVRQKLAEMAQDILTRIQNLESAEEFELARTRANYVFIQNSVPPVKQAAKSDFGITLTDEQAVAVATDEDATLVLAGAGTGKTAVITSKVSHLVRNEGVAPEDILVLAFNRAAAKEIRAKLQERIKGTNVYTFHAFGRSVIARHGVKPSISTLAEDERKLAKTVHDWFNDLCDVPDQASEVTDFVAYNLTPYSSPFDFETAGEYYEFVDTWEPRTLNDVKVKSLEELEIANFLSLNGIEFRYERPYPVPTANSRHSQYKPDFYLPEYDIYIEHFALNQYEQAPNGWKDYLEGVEWKRGIHEQNKTKLIETYSWQCSEGILQDALRDKLESHDVKFRSVPIKDLLKKLTKWVINWLTRLLVQFLNHVKTNDISSDELNKRVESGIPDVRQIAFLKLFEKIRDRYDSALRTERALDFHDLINKVAALIRNGRSNASYRYVLVDEFQDISAGRMELLRSLNSRDTAYYLVGDDWQSINRFAGSDVNLLRNCAEYLGHTQTMELSQTFRYGNGILAPASQFVRKNPIQTQRVMKPATGQIDHGISIIASTQDDQGFYVEGLKIALKDIKERVDATNQSECNVLVLGRYRFNIPRLPTNARRNGKLCIRYSTVHSAKGQEADYVIVLGLSRGRFGFPCKIEDDPLLQLVMPRPVQGELRFSEERRLFYVAITRARRGAYLVVDSDRPSEFVRELRKDHRLRKYGTIDDDLRPPCPNCATGKLVKSQSGENLRCKNYPSCNHLAPLCENCRKGFTVTSGSGDSKCTNESCVKPALACPKCLTGVLTLKTSSYGPFWGCTNYWAEPPCEF